jgi:hypothetical protein
MFCHIWNLPSEKPAPFALTLSSLPTSPSQSVTQKRQKTRKLPHSTSWRIGPGCRAFAKRLGMRAVLCRFAVFFPVNPQPTTRSALNRSRAGAFFSLRAPSRAGPLKPLVEARRASIESVRRIEL